jgi:cysteine desulfurase
VTASPEPLVYLDHNASSPLLERVLEEMLPHLRPDRVGNPSSVHVAGRAARAAVERARERVAASIGSSEPARVRFTSGGTESNNLAVFSWARVRARGGRHLLTTPIEHSSILAPLRALAEESGFEVETLPVDDAGRVEPAEFRARLRDDTALACIGLANNEIGTLQPVARCAEYAREKGVPLHTDAVQALGKIPIDVRALGISSAAFSAHKLGGPMGIGALYVAPGATLPPLLRGGGQEEGVRPGSTHVAGAVGFGAAAELAMHELPERVRAWSRLAVALRTGIASLDRRARFNGPDVVESRLANTVNVAFPEIDGDALRINLDLDGVCISAGSACASGSIEPSHVLLAIGLEPALACSALRISLGPRSSDGDAARFLEALSRALETSRAVVKRS